MLDDFEDADAILLDTGEQTSGVEVPLYWVGMDDIGNPPRLDGDRNKRYDSFGDYVKDRLPSVQDFIEPQYVRYDAADFPEGRGGG